jgi:hypothetical protein
LELPQCNMYFSHDNSHTQILAESIFILHYRLFTL